LEFLFAHVQVQPPARNVELDDVAVAHHGQRPVGGSECGFPVLQDNRGAAAVAASVLNQTETAMQLDIFEHSHEVILRNDVIEALARHDASAARAACDRLAFECPVDESLGDMRALLKIVERSGPRSFANHAALKEARQTVEGVETVAVRIFGSEVAPQWLGIMWATLALGAGALHFRADDADDHAAPLWLRARNWKAAAQAVGTIESWRRIPAPLAWMTQARLHLLGLPATWPLIAELGWLSPARLVELLGLERRGRQRDIVERRKTLRDLHPGLYAQYMRVR